MKLAIYWEQENAHWQAHPEARPEDVGKQRWPQFWRMWDAQFGKGAAKAAREALG